jgi:hypothetical protein
MSKSKSLQAMATMLALTGSTSFNEQTSYERIHEEKLFKAAEGTPEERQKLAEKQEEKDNF